MKRGILFVFLLLAWAASSSARGSYRVQSPDGSLEVEVTVGGGVSFVIRQDGAEVTRGSVSMTLGDGEVLGESPRVTGVERRSEDAVIASPFYKRAEVRDRHNEMRLSFRGGYGLVFRAYDDGAAYRFVTERGGELVVAEEGAEYAFPGKCSARAAYVNSTRPTFEEQFFNSFEQPYAHAAVSELDAGRLKILPLLVELEDGRKVCVTEADLEDYPGMFLNNEPGRSVLRAVHAPYPKVEEQGGHNRLQMLVREREGYIARTSGRRAFPWRVFVVARDDRELADCDMVYRLASPSRVEDVSWIRPGKVAWEWWNDWNLYGVDFRTGVNNATYKRYIDFAAAHGVEYVILDEGWAVNLEADMTRVVPEIDLEELVAYGGERGVGIILWAGYWAFARDMERVVAHYAGLGVKGFKIDFLDRDDQKMVNFVYAATEVCARHRMLVDFHGVSKPTGLQRTFPNVLNYEAVNGLEQVKWSSEREFDMVTYDVTIPFVRMVAGPMDYTQGAMRNAARGTHRASNSEPMSQGTRCRQLAMYVVFESPLNMLCDSPSNYEREEECAEFIAGVPTVWDETVALEGKVGEYVAVARRSGEVWYVGALTDWTGRELELDLSFLGEGDFLLEVFEDGVNADRVARDYRRREAEVGADRRLRARMAPGGGFAARIRKAKAAF